MFAWLCPHRFEVCWGGCVRGNVPAVSEGAAVRETGWEKRSSGGVKRNNVGALGGTGWLHPSHIAAPAPTLCNLHLCGVTSKSRVFWERLGQIAIISFLSSASIWCLSIPPKQIQRTHACTHIQRHTHIYRNTDNHAQVHSNRNKKKVYSVHANHSYPFRLTQKGTREDIQTWKQRQTDRVYFY